MMTVDDVAMPDGARLVRLQRKDDARGSLVVGELTGLIPFKCRRIFMIYDVPAGASRGGHAHRACHQLLIAASGRVHVHVDGGTSCCDVLLEGPETGLYLPPMTWCVQSHYSSDCTLLVLASHPYDAGDYIHDHAEFLAMKGVRE